jgi:hypothetical protein
MRLARPGNVSGMPERRGGRPVASAEADAERAALVEAAFRIANERTTEWPERHSDGRPELYLCECAALECRARVALTREQYEAARGDPQHFIVFPGHERLEIETVVEVHDGYSVVRKPDVVRHIVVAADPRFTGVRDPFAAATALSEHVAARDARRAKEEP